MSQQPRHLILASAIAMALAMPYAAAAQQVVTTPPASLQNSNIRPTGGDDSTLSGSAGQSDILPTGPSTITIPPPGAPAAPAPAPVPPPAPPPPITLSSFTLTAPAASEYLGQSYTLNWTAAQLDYGTGAVTYTTHWSVSNGSNGNLAPTTGLSIADSVNSSPTTISYYVTASAAGVTRQSNTVSIKIVDAPMSVSVTNSPTSATVLAGTPACATWTAHVSGGRGPYTYKWYDNTGTASTDTYCGIYNTPGTYAMGNQVTVTDVFGQVAAATSWDQVTVTAPPPPPPPPPGGGGPCPANAGRQVNPALSPPPCQIR